MDEPKNNVTWVAISGRADDGNEHVLNFDFHDDDLDHSDQMFSLVPNATPDAPLGWKPDRIKFMRRHESRVEPSLLSIPRANLSDFLKGIA